MKSVKAFGLLAVMALSISIGCKKEPDPRTLPGFNANSAKDPGSIKMTPDITKPPESN